MYRSGSFHAQEYGLTDCVSIKFDITESADENLPNVGSYTRPIHFQKTIAAGRCQFGRTAEAGQII